MVPNPSRYAKPKQLGKCVRLFSGSHRCMVWRMHNHYLPSEAVRLFPPVFRTILDSSSDNPLIMDSRWSLSALSAILASFRTAIGDTDAAITDRSPHLLEALPKENKRPWMEGLPWTAFVQDDREVMCTDDTEPSTGSGKMSMLDYMGASIEDLSVHPAAESVTQLRPLMEAGTSGDIDALRTMTGLMAKGD